MLDTIDNTAAVASANEERLRDSLRMRTARLAVLGMGYVGLPMAIEFARSGFEVLGIEADPDRYEALAEGRSYIADLPSETLREALATGRMRPCADPDALAEADVILICVPTPLRKSKDPDLSA